MRGARPAALTQLEAGERGTIRAIAGDHDVLVRLSALGFSIGAEVRMVQNARSCPIVVLVRSTRVALAREVAAAIGVEGLCYGLPRPA